MKSPEITVPSEEFILTDGHETDIFASLHISQPLELAAKEKPPVNEVEAMARLYGRYGVTAASMASSPVLNEIYTIPMDKAIYNE